MTLCLYECLKAVGLQSHYARFTSVGVHRAAHLSRLTMEDYPILGIRSMEDRTRLFHLVQMIKTLDLDDLEYGDCVDEDYNTDGDNGSFASADINITFDGCGDPDRDVYVHKDDKDAAVSTLNTASFSKPSSVRRQLDFSFETTDHHQRLFSCPVGTAYVYTSRNKNTLLGQGKGSAMPVQFKSETGSTVVCSCKESSNHRLDVHSHKSYHHTGANTKQDIMERVIEKRSYTRSSPKCVSSLKPKPVPATVASKRLSNKPVGHEDRKGNSWKEKLCTEESGYTASEEMTKSTPVYESKRINGYNYGLPLSSPPTPSKKHLGGQRICVCVRKRPLTHRECKRGESDVVSTLNGECVIVSESKETVNLTEYILQHKFYFDQVFGEESSNEEVYGRTAYPLVQHMLNGGKATCFAYGQTGAGKTYTMLGSSTGRPGLYALAAQDIFTHLSTTHTHSALLVYVSFFEIYCGQLYDLLDHRKRLFAREDGQKVVHIAGLRNVKVDSEHSLLEVISQGTEERTQGVSGVNPLSSRSHALLQIQLRGQNQQIAGRMWFVDLAGSERASDTKEPDRQSRMEGAEINQSLLALKECIRSLDQEQSHTPFRQSKLTQVLKDSFVGNSMTCMIANISPGHLATEHTLNTLRYADRVKELRRQGGLKEVGKGNSMLSPKHNLSKTNSSSGIISGGTRGKSPPKKPKLGRQRKASGTNTPTLSLATVGAVPCSTPKTRRWEEGTNARARWGLGLEQISPIRGLQGIVIERERGEKAGGRDGKREERESNGGTGSTGYSTDEKNTEAGLILGQQAGKESHVLEVKVSGFCHKEKEKHQSTWTGVRDGERRWIEPRKQVESNRDTCSEVERLREGDLQKVGKREERERHLRWYHHQLQQYKPSSSSSSYRLLSPSTCSSFSLSNQTSLTSSVSPSSCSSLHQPHSISASALMCHGLEKILDADRGRIKVGTNGNREQSSFFPTREIYLHSETSPNYNRNKDDGGYVDSGGGYDWRVFEEGTEPKFGQDKGKSETRRSLKATGEVEARAGREDWRLVGMKGGTEGRLAWVATTETEKADRMASARPAEETLVSYSCDSEVGGEELDLSDIQADRMWNTEDQEGADGYSNNDCSPVESLHQRAQAERPLSPASDHTNTQLTYNKLSDRSLGFEHMRSISKILHIPPQNAQQAIPTSQEKEPSFAAMSKRREFQNAQSATLPLTIPITPNVCKIPAEPFNILSKNTGHPQVHNDSKVKDNMSVIPQEETSIDSCSNIMDPLSISLLQVDQQVATASFLQGEQNNTSLFLPENQRREDKKQEVGKEAMTCMGMAGKVVEDGDVGVQLSLFELPQAKTDCFTSVCFATHEHCGIGTLKPPIPEVMPVSIQNQENNQKHQTTSAIKVLDNKANAPQLKPSASTETFMQSNLDFIQHTENNDSASSHDLLTNGTSKLPTIHAPDIQKKLDFSISTQQSGSVLGHLDTFLKQCHIVNSNHISNSSIALQSKSSTQSNSEESASFPQIRPIVHLSTLENLYHSQWRVVQAHLEQLEEMETLCHKEGMLLCKQPDMAFGEYVHKLGEIMGRKAKCVNSMIAQLQPYLKTSHCNQQHNQGEDNHDQVV